MGGPLWLMAVNVYRLIGTWEGKWGNKGEGYN